MTAPHPYAGALGRGTLAPGRTLVGGECWAEGLLTPGRGHKWKGLACRPLRGWRWYSATRLTGWLWRGLAGEARYRRER